MNNGSIFFGDNNVNERGNNRNYCNDSSCKKFDETKKESANGVNRITVVGSVNVKVSACNTNEITAHLYGSTITDGHLEFSVTRRGDEIQVSVETNDIYIFQNFLLKVYTHK